MEWTIQQVADHAGITSRTLRHYDEIGLLPPSRVGTNGYRFYDTAAVARLQRILLLRDLGLRLPVIAEVLDQQCDAQAALAEHITLLQAERDRIDQRIRAIDNTMQALARGSDPSMKMMLDGFNDRYRDEVVARWGEQAFRDSNAWWHGKTLCQRIAWKHETDDLIAAWIAAAGDRIDPTGQQAMDLAERHVAWLRNVPGTPMADGDRQRSIALLRGLGRLYVEDPCFAETYGGQAGASFVRACLEHYADTRM